MSFSPARRVDVAERRARLVSRHLLAPRVRVTSVLAVADALVALHATDPATVYLSVAARTEGVTADDVTTALHVDRGIRKLLCMRRTLFALPSELVPVAAAAASRAVVVRERKALVQHLAQAGVADAGAFLDAALEATVAALREAGEATAAELADIVPALRQEVDPAPGKAYGGPTRITSRVMTILGASGLAVRGRPIGGLTSSLTTWEPAPDGLAAEQAAVDEAAARALLARRWLWTFGPGTDADLAWWLGCTLTQARAALQACGAVTVDVGGSDGHLLPEDVDEVGGSDASVALLPGLDPTTMGWSARDWYLGDHKAAVFDRNGNAGPTVWCDGRVVGAWAQRADGSVAWRLLEPVRPDAEDEIAERAAFIERWLGDVRVTPRFPSPLERELRKG